MGKDALSEAERQMLQASGWPCDTWMEVTGGTSFEAKTETGDMLIFFYMDMDDMYGLFTEQIEM